MTAGLAIKQAARWTLAAVGALTVASAAGLVITAATAAWWVQRGRE